MNTTELKALAEKATPGPWLHEKENVHTGGVCSVNQGGEPWFEVWSPNWMDAPAKNNEADAAYIAAANPAEILELIAKLEDAQGEIRALRATEAGLRERVKELEQQLAEVRGEQADLAAVAMRFVDRAGDPHPGIDDAETICANFHDAVSAVVNKYHPMPTRAAIKEQT